MRYEGYHEDSKLPFRQGQEVVIPAGIEVKSTNPSKRHYTTSRQQTVTINHFLPGRSVSNHMALGDKHIARELTERGFNWEALLALRESNHADYYNGRVALDNPTVVWAGAGGYWCEVDINDILEANGIATAEVTA